MKDLKPNTPLIVVLETYGLLECGDDDLVFGFLIKKAVEVPQEDNTNNLLLLPIGKQGECERCGSTTLYNSSVYMESKMKIKLVIYQAVISIFRLDADKNLVYEARTIIATSEMYSSIDSVMNMCKAQNELVPDFNRSITIVQISTNYLYEDGTLNYDTMEILESTWNYLPESVSLLKSTSEPVYKLLLLT